MKYYLLKTEPGEYSYDDLEGEPKAVWSGVTSAPALLQLRSMNKGDKAFIYHTGTEKRIIGTATILSAAYPDPKGNDPRHVVVDVKADARLPKPVTLTQVKGTKVLADMPLVTNGRLSVQPVTEKQWNLIINLSTQ